MKRLLVTMCVLSLAFVAKESIAQQDPYTANYSSNFQIGDPANSKMILELWKDYDDNAFDRHDYFADTAVMFFPDGSMVRGKDSIIAGAKRFRGALTSATSTLNAWVPLKSVDRDENWVAVWGTETDVTPDGKTNKTDIHEIWRINKDGKVDFMKQFASKPVEMQQ